MAGTRVPISPKVKVLVYTRDNWRCQYCGMKFEPGPLELTGRYAPCTSGGVYLELDHVIPVRHGGTNDPANLRAACSPCNRAKATRTSHVDWPARLLIATQIIAEGPPTKRTAERAAEALTGAPVRLKNRRK